MYEKIFRPRTCVEPELEFNSQNELLINYKEQTVTRSVNSDEESMCEFRRDHLLSGLF